MPDPRERKRGKSDGLYIAGIVGSASLQVGLGCLSGVRSRVVRAGAADGLSLCESRSGWGRVVTWWLLSPHDVRVTSRSDVRVDVRE